MSFQLLPEMASELGVPEVVDPLLLRDRLDEAVRRLVGDPRGPHAFATGGQYAVERLFYDSEQVARLPVACADRFRGVGNPHRIGPVAPGEVVLDPTAGAGFDLLLATQRVGASGRAIGVESSNSLRAVAEECAHSLGLGERVTLLAGDGEALPIATHSVDVVISNGTLARSFEKERVLAEMARVLRPGGRLHLAEIVLTREPGPVVRQDVDLWVAGVAGALVEERLISLLARFGFGGARLIERFCRATSWSDCGRHGTVAHGATFWARAGGAPTP